MATALLDWTGRPIQTTKAAPGAPLIRTEYQSYQAEHGRPWPVDYANLLRRYEGWVHHCSRINEHALAEVPWHLYAMGGSNSTPTRGVGKKQAAFVCRLPQARRKGPLGGGEFDEVLDHPALTIWDAPNPYQTGREFRMMLEAHRGLTGNAYVWKQRGALGVTGMLWIVPPQHMHIVPGPGELVAGYLYSKDATNKIAFDADEIIHLRRPNPSDPYFYGYGEVESEYDVSELGRAIDDYEKWTLKNNARPDFVVEAESGFFPTKQQRADFRQEWRRLHGRVTDAGKVAILTGGLSVKPLNFTPRDVSYLKGEDKVMRRIGMAFGIPKSMLTTDDVNLANARIGERQHAKYTIKPRLEYDTEIFTERWLAEYDERLFWGFDDPVPEDAKEQAEVDKIHIDTGLRVINELRERDNFPPLPGGDVRYEPPAPNFGPPIEEAPEAPKPPKAAPRRKHAEPETPVDSQEIRAMAADLRDVFARQRRALLGRPAPKGVLPIGPIDIAVSDVEIDAIMAELADLAEPWIADTNAALLPHLRGRLDAGAQGGLAQLSGLGVAVEGMWDINDPNVEKFIRGYSRRFSEGLTQTTFNDIKRALAAGLREGESIPKIRDRIMGLYDGYERNRATMVARTETSRALQVGHIESWRVSGVVRGKRWVVGAGACEFCAAMDGQEVALGDSFVPLDTDVGGVDEKGEATGHTYHVDYATLPGGAGIDIAELHPNCRCDVVPILIEAYAEAVRT